jgi:hypothetical protein
LSTKRGGRRRPQSAVNCSRLRASPPIDNPVNRQRMKVQVRRQINQFNRRTTPTELEIRECVRNLLASHYGRAYGIERRSERRFPFPHLVCLTPLADDGRTPLGPAIVGVGRELSEGGFGFFHPSPLPYRQMIASLESARGEWIHLAIDLTWCRFMRHGWYESGGRFLRTLSLPPPTLTQPPPPEFQI